MQAIVNAGTGHGVQMELAFEDFIASGHMHSLARAGMCTPYDLILDHLPGFDCGDPDEIREAFAEACEEASEYGVRKVKLDDDDIEFVRREFLENRRFRLTGYPPLRAA